MPTGSSTPNIVRIHEVGMHEGQHYFSMDLIDGNNLEEWNKEGGSRTIDPG